MDNISLVITTSVFLMTLLTVLGISSYLGYRSSRKDWRERLKGAGEAATSLVGAESFSPEKPRVFQLLEAMGQAARPKNVDEMSHLRRTLMKAGYRRAEAPLFSLGSNSASPSSSRWLLRWCAPLRCPCSHIRTPCTSLYCWGLLAFTRQISGSK
jgi:hypothetical protein